MLILPASRDGPRMMMVVMVLLACTTWGQKVVEGEGCNNVEQNQGEKLVIIPVKGC